MLHLKREGALGVGRESKLLGKLDVCQAEQDLSCKTADNGVQDDQWVSSAKQNHQRRLKPADHLAHLREQIRTLKLEEAAIREGLVDGSLDLEGDYHDAVITTVVNERIDLRAMRQHVPESVWRPYVIAAPSVYVRITDKRINKTSDAKKSSA
jgi:hypothetical protein